MTLRTGKRVLEIVQPVRRPLHRAGVDARAQHQQCDYLSCSANTIAKNHCNNAGANPTHTRRDATPRAVETARPAPLQANLRLLYALQERLAPSCAASSSAVARAVRASLRSRVPSARGEIERTISRHTRPIHRPAPGSRRSSWSKRIIDRTGRRPCRSPRRLALRPEAGALPCRERHEWSLLVPVLDCLHERDLDPSRTPDIDRAGDDPPTTRPRSAACFRQPSSILRSLRWSAAYASRGISTIKATKRRIGAGK